MIKALLLDADGIVIQGRKRYFSDIIAEEKGLDVADVLKFFQNEYKKCVVGQAELKDEVAKYLTAWKWDKSVDELLGYWFSCDGNPSEEVLDLVKQLRNSGLRVYIASDHTKYRAEDIMKRLKMEEYFDGSFFSCNTGYTKKEIGFYTYVKDKLGLLPSEIMFWDDEKEKVEVGKQAGVVGIVYENFEMFKETLKNTFYSDAI